MSAIIRMLSYSIEIMISKSALKKISIIQYLAKKYLIGIIIYFIYFMYSEKILVKSGIVFLTLTISLTVLRQFFSFASLKLVNSSTHVVIKQIRVVLLVLVGVFFNYKITLVKILAAIAISAGTILIINEEKKSSDNKKNTMIGIALALISSIINVVNIYIFEYALRSNFFNASTYTFATILTVMGVFIFLDIVSKRTDKAEIDRKSFWMIQLTGILSICVVLTKAISFQEVGYFISEMIYATSPIFILIVLAILKIEKMSLKKVMGVLVGFVGVYFSLLV